MMNQEIEVPSAAPHPMQLPANVVHVVPPDDNDADDHSVDKSSREGPRRVRFNEQLAGVCIPSHHDMSKEARQDIWYSKADLSQIRLEIRQDRGVIRRHQLLHDDRAGRLVPPETDVFTSRGIEHLVSPQTFEKLIGKQTRLIREVLEGQHRHQHCVGVDKDESLQDDYLRRLAELSSSMSACAVARAIDKGAADQAFVLGG